MAALLQLVYKLRSTERVPHFALRQASLVVSSMGGKSLIRYAAVRCLYHRHGHAVGNMPLSATPLSSLYSLHH